MPSSIKIKPKGTSTRYVALDATKKSKILAEGRSVEAVKRRADRTGKAYSMMYIPPKGNTYIY